ncbi:OmpA family protein, partial [Sphingosinicella sp.]|uniref:OmpA family protein n=1 Tax=Sphingosinicella sp. TaxID=1917971 RepID=UPI0017D8782B
TVPPPPPPPTPGPFIVFFDFDKSDITTDAADILNRAAQAYKETGQASVTLAGHADAAGPADYNVGLSQRRADAVRKYLVGQGVPETAVASEAFGETRLLVETADGVREPQNRRVEINFGGASM